MNEFNDSLSQQGKDDGVAATLAAQGDEWRLKASAMVLAYIREHGPCLAEDAREHCLNNGLSDPSSPNAWGGVTAGLSRVGKIAMSGQWAKSRAKKSHARMQPMWRAT